MLQRRTYLLRWLISDRLMLYALLLAFLVLNSAALAWAYRWLEAEKVRLDAAMQPKQSRTVDALADAINGLHIEMQKVEAKAEKARRIAQSVSGQVGNQRRQEMEQAQAQVLPMDEEPLNGSAIRRRPPPEEYV